MHDFLLDIRGAERVFLELCDMWPAADIYTAVYDEEGTEGRFSGRSVHSSFLQRLRPTARGFRALLPLYPAAIESFDLSSYELVVSSSSAWAHAVLCDEASIHVSYCHNPFRYAWNDRDSTISSRRNPLTRGLIRVGLAIPAQAEFELAGVDDPYEFASATELSLFRRPLPVTNLKFLTSVMWDGRESGAGRTIVRDLLAQAAGAANAHGQGAALGDEQRRAIIDFERVLFTAQSHDRRVGALDAERAAGGPRALGDQPVQFAINSLMDQTGTPPTRRVFTLFDAWTSSPDETRRAVASGQTLFNERAFGARRVTCSGCHNAPNAGSNSTGAFFEGVAGEAQRPAALPLYTLRCARGSLEG